METGPFDKIKIRINGQGDIKIDKTQEKLEWFSQYVDRFIENVRTYADDPAIYMHNHALSAIETYLLIPTFRKVRDTFDNPGHCFIFLCLSKFVANELRRVDYVGESYLSVVR